VISRRDWVAWVGSAVEALGLRGARGLEARRFVGSLGVEFSSSDMVIVLVIFKKLF
jgi:hypothetical protein